MQKDIRDLLSTIVNELTAQREWYDLRAACERKGINFNTVKSKSEFQPAKGIADTYITGKRMWHFTTIQGWLLITDDGVFAPQGETG